MDTVCGLVGKIMNKNKQKGCDCVLNEFAQFPSYCQNSKCSVHMLINIGCPMLYTSMYSLMHSVAGYFTLTPLNGQFTALYLHLLDIFI